MGGLGFFFRAPFLHLPDPPSEYKAHMRQECMGGLGFRASGDENVGFSVGQRAPGRLGGGV